MKNHKFNHKNLVFNLCGSANFKKIYIFHRAVKQIATRNASEKKTDISYDNADAFL